MLAYKQLTKQILRNRTYVVMVALLAILTPLSFFFVRYTIDGNVGRIDEIAAAGGDRDRFQTALASNTILANCFFPCLLLLTAFVLFIFYYRFFRSSRKQMGVLKALGFKDSYLRCYFAVITAALALIGGLLGLALGYPLSQVLIQANMETYGVSGLVRRLGIGSALTGVLVPAAVFFLTSFFSYGFIRGKEPGALLAGNLTSTAKHRPMIRKLSLRIALRKPLAVVLLVTAVLSFSTCMILAYSLNISSKKIFTSQTKGHSYEYLARYDQIMDDRKLPEETMGMLAFDADLENMELSQNVGGFVNQNGLYELRDRRGALLSAPLPGKAIIGPGLGEVYGINIGDWLVIKLDGNKRRVQVEAVAANAQSATLYINSGELAELAGVPAGSWNILLSNAPPVEAPSELLSRQERIHLLERDAVSNKISGVINQVIGAVVGCILLFLALYISFQDNTHDMLVLHLLGYRPKAIRKMMLDCYRPLVWAAYVITLPLGIALVKSIQRSLSVTTGDYMPFGTNALIILFTALALTLIYQLVQWTFNSAIRRMIEKEEISEYTDS